jgi:hypothetical protein
MRAAALSIFAAGSVLIPCGAWAAPDSATCLKFADHRSLPEARARSLFNDASAREAADPQGALARYECAQDLADRPAIALRIGTLAERLGQRELAIRQFERYLALAGSDAPDREDMVRHIDELRKSIEASKPPPAPPPAEPPAHAVRWMPLGLAGVGVLAIGGGVVLLVLAESESHEVHDLAPGTPWVGNASDTFASAQRNEVAGIVALSLGAAATGAGLFWFFRAGPERQATVGLTPTRGGARLTVSF